MAKNNNLGDFLQDLANTIRTKKGTSAQINAQNFSSEIASIPLKTVVEWQQCPTAVKNYIDNVTYDPSDYTTSQIQNYAPTYALTSNTKPIGTTVDSVTYYNEVPNALTPFSSTNIAGTLNPLYKLRWLNTATGNVRDLGGWSCDGGTIKYGKLFRGAEPETSDKSLMVNQIGIKHELNLRGNEVAHRDYSVWDIEYSQFDGKTTYSLSDKDIWYKQLKVIFDCVKYDKPIYIHCQAGCDRTGTVVCILEALLGVSQSDIDKDYEISSFYTGTLSEDTIRSRTLYNWKKLINEIKSITLPSGVADTFRNHAIYFVASLGFSAAEINAFRVSMINGTPETITLSLSNYSITNTLTHITSNNQETTIAQYQTYKATLSAEASYEITSVTLTMGGSDIKQNSYKQIVYPNQQGIIEIPRINGNIVITATAEYIIVPIVNILDTIGYSDGYRVKTSSGDISALSGATAFGTYDCSNLSSNDVIRIYCPNGIPASSNNAYAVQVFDGATFKVGDYIYQSHLGTDALGRVCTTTSYDTTTKILTLSGFNNYSANKFRISLTANGADCIMTLNQEITV